MFVCLIIWFVKLCFIWMLLSFSIDYLISEDCLLVGFISCLSGGFIWCSLIWFGHFRLCCLFYNQLKCIYCVVVKRSVFDFESNIWCTIGNIFLYPLAKSTYFTFNSTVLLSLIHPWNTIYVFFKILPYFEATL